MGKFDSAQQMLNLNSIGVDYQPPTPAVREHIIGDDDDAHPASMMAKPFNPANALYGSSMHPHRPNSNLNHRRPPSSSVPRPLPNQRHVKYELYWPQSFVFESTIQSPKCSNMRDFFEIDLKMIYWEHI